MKKKISLLSILSLFIITSVGYAQPSKDAYVVLVSMDGFRWDYGKKFNLPNLNLLAKNGVKAKSLQPSYPTKTFPNHYSIATGLYPDHHGIINNVFFDPTMQEHFSLGSKAKYDSRFYGGNPIWNLAEKQGVKAASFFWPGSDIDKNNPTYFKTYDDKIPYDDRIDTVINWLQLPEADRPHLITLYFDQPDHTGHGFGPLSKENEAVIQNMDLLMGQLITRLDALPIGNQINLIIVSDHGMANISDAKKVALLDYINPDWLGYKTVINPIMSLQAEPGHKNDVAKALKKIPHIKFWAATDVPKRLHYGSNKRVHDFVIEAKKGYSLVSKSSQQVKGGTHGYDNRQKDMHAIFYAKGPAFKKNYKVGTFQNVSIYPLIAHILDLETETIDGNLNEVKKILNY